MQSYTPEFNKNLPDINPDYFAADNRKQLNKMMKIAAKQKQKKGYKVKSRRSISPDEHCPCESGEKFSLCCMTKAIKA